MSSLENKVAIITGSSRGIGAEIARTLASAGAAVVLNYTANEAAARQVVNEIENAGGKAVAVCADVAKSSDVIALFTKAEEHFGKVDILINNAGIMFNKTIQETNDEELDAILAVNVKGAFYCLREAASKLADGGRVINISSTVTRISMPTYGPYAATKGALGQLTKVFSKEVGPRNITVNTVLPGPTNTELFNEGKTEEFLDRLRGMTALGRIGEVSDIAKVVLFLVSEEAGWITGQEIGANGGFA